MNIGLVIPTLNAGASFELLLKKIEQQNEKIVEKIIIDSGSTDDTVKIGKKYNYRIIEIKENNLNCKYLIVSEAGASIYSASKVALEEFPDLAISSPTFTSWLLATEILERCP